jgi:hypothetical protein
VGSGRFLDVLPRLAGGSVAERAGNSMELLLSRYAKCIDGRQEIAKRKIRGAVAPIRVISRGARLRAPRTLPGAIAVQGLKEPVQCTL